MPIEDKLYPLLRTYNNSPAWLRNTLGKMYRLVPMRFRYGKLYNHYKNLLKESPYWSDKQVNEFTLCQLKDTLINAFENTYYYQELFSKVGFDPYGIKDISEIQKIPFSDKHTLREYKDQIKNRSIPDSNLMYVTTGGTSGVPVELYFTKGRERTREFVFMTHQWERIGYKISDRVARIRGTVVDSKGKNELFKFEPVKNRLLLSSYDLHQDKFDVFVEKLLEFKPHFIHTYPSAVLPLAKYVISRGIVFPGLKGIFCSSEQFYPGQRELIEKAFNARVYSWYGHSENTTLAGECEVSQNYHIFHEYGYTELVDEQGNVITEPGIQGEIVGTSFEMKGFPIIRYRTGDFAEYVEGRCKCKRNYRLVTNVKGRWLQEMIITHKNSGISLTALNFHTNIFDNVLQYQYYQKEKGAVTLRIIKSANYSEQDEQQIIKQHNEKLKDLVDFTITYMDNLPKTGRGKHKYLIQEITD